MNIPYFISYISTQLQTNLVQYTLKGDVLQQEVLLPHTFTVFSDQPEGITLLLSASSYPVPVIVADDYHLAYAIVATPEYLLQIGPVRIEEPVQFLHYIPDGVSHEDIQQLPTCTFPTFVQHILLLRNVLCPTTVNRQELLEHNIHTQAEQEVKKYFSNILFQNQEMGKMHNPYDQEVREIGSIRNGDMQQLEKSLSENVSGHYGVLAKDHLRSLKNICIVVITLASRAAIEGGVSPEIAFSLSDSYIYKIEELSDAHTIHRLCRNAEYEYTRLVYDIKRVKISSSHKMVSTNPRITQCKDYIFKHLHEKISIQHIAKELKTNASYLAELFSQSEGITIRDFIMQEKVNLARNLLIYSEYSYSEIATSLGFCSQSHFGKNFKEVTSITPKQYRDAYGVKHAKQIV